MADRLTSTEILKRAGTDDWPELKVGDKVRVLFSVQDPIAGEIVDAPDRNGWVKVREDEYPRTVFLALAACCELLVAT